MENFRKSITLPLPPRRKFSTRHRSSIKSHTSSGRTADDGTMLESSHSFSIADPTHALAIEAAKDANIHFLESMPQSLIDERIHEHDCIAPFKWDECILGPLLGSGQFSDVYRIRSFSLTNHQDADSDNGQLSKEEINQRLLMKGCEKYRQTTKARYALKQVKPDHLEKHEGRIKYIEAAGDLALEKEFLTSLAHPNIIKLRGIANSGPTGFALIIDSLVETLDQRIERWRKIAKPIRRVASISNLKSSFTSMIKVKSELSIAELALKSEQKMESDEVFHDRLAIALQIAAAMKYLHSHSIVFRDLKPTNIGFDVRGDVKLFDFGLARFCVPHGDPNNDTFKMSIAGSPRYMSPECLSGLAYNTKTDVYSFAVVLWEILAKKTPYVFARRKDQLVKYVVDEYGRPDIEQHWPAVTKSMLESSFDANMVKRPIMEQVYSDIREAISSLRDGESSTLDDEWVSRRRSFDSIDGVNTSD